MNTKSFGAVLTFGLCASAWAATPIEIPLGGTLVIDNFANADANSALGPWDIYPDASGKTTLDTSFVSKAGVNGTSNALRLNYYLEGYDILDYDPFVEAAVYVDKNSAAVDFLSGSLAMLTWQAIITIRCSMVNIPGKRQQSIGMISIKQDGELTAISIT